MPKSATSWIALVVTGANPKKVQKLYKVLAYNVESQDVESNVCSVLDKL